MVGTSILIICPDFIKNNACFYERSNGMEEIFKQYGGPIIMVLVIVAILAIMALLLAVNGPVKDMFDNLLKDFFNLAQLRTNG